jgi:hypothetical protein
MLWKLRSQIRARIVAMSHLMERLFARFADVPYETPISQQQWEELWESTSNPSLHG